MGPLLLDIICRNKDYDLHSKSTEWSLRSHHLNYTLEQDSTKGQEKYCTRKLSAPLAPELLGTNTHNGNKGEFEVIPPVGARDLTTSVYLYHSPFSTKTLKTHGFLKENYKNTYASTTLVSVTKKNQFNKKRC